VSEFFQDCEMKLSKYFYVALIGYICSSAHAQAIKEIKLSCDISIKTSLPSGAIEREQHSITVNIFQQKSFLSINPSSVLRGVITEKKAGVFEVINLSDENSWDVTNKSKSSSDKVTTTQMKIDRNTGHFSYTNDFEEGRLFAEASGTCTKVDTSKKKF
jgi:hypothetical protein